MLFLVELDSGTVINLQQISFIRDRVAHLEDGSEFPISEEDYDWMKKFHVRSYPEIADAVRHEQANHLRGNGPVIVPNMR